MSCNMSYTETYSLLYCEVNRDIVWHYNMVYYDHAECRVRHR